MSREASVIIGAGPAGLTAAYELGKRGLTSTVRSQFTVWFERLAIDLLWECSVTGAKRVLRISWDEAWGFKTRTVRRGLARRQAEVVTHLGVDEKAIAKRHRYLTVVADLERHRVLYLADDPGAAETFAARWYWRATHSRLKPMAGVATLIKRHLPNRLTYLTHKITNAGLEAVNSVIQGVKKAAREFRNPEHFKIAIHFRCGGLDLYPHESR